MIVAMEQQFIDAVQQGNWSVLSFLFLFGVLSILKSNSVGQVVGNWLDQYKVKWLVPVAIAFCGGFTVAFQEGLSWQVSLLRGIAAIVTSALPAMGVHSLLKDSPVPYNGPGGASESK